VWSLVREGDDSPSLSERVAVNAQSPPVGGLICFSLDERSPPEPLIYQKSVAVHTFRESFFFNSLRASSAATRKSALGKRHTLAILHER
jgi:hypothetical protein